MSGFFFNLGRQIGRAAIPAIRKSKWIWDDLTGSEEDALRAERALGTVLAAELRHATEPADDPALSQRVHELCRGLGDSLKESRRTFHAEAYQADFPNAMALPGGFIFLSDSLVQFCGDHSDQLAFIIGHEMGHIVRGHARERMLNQTALRAASAVISRAGGPLGAWIRHKGVHLLQSAHSKQSEFEADEFGIRLAAAAGFDPEGAVTFLRRIEEIQPAGQVLGPYFASHPSPQDRIVRLLPRSNELSSGEGKPR